MPASPRTDSAEPAPAESRRGIASDRSGDVLHSLAFMGFVTPILVIVTAPLFVVSAVADWASRSLTCRWWNTNPFCAGDMPLLGDYL